MATKVVHVCTVGVTAVRLLLPQCEFLRQNGYDVSFVFSPGQEADKIRQEGFSVKELYIDRRIRPWFDINSMLGLEKYFRREKPTIVHTHTSKAGVAGRIAAARAGVPIVVHTVHGFPFHPGMNTVKYSTYVLIERLAARCSSVLLSQSREDVQNAYRLSIIPKTGKVIWIGNGVDVDHFNPARLTAEDKQRIKKGLGLKPNHTILTTIGRVNREKGYGDLIQAAAKLRGSWQFLCIGEDEGYLEEAKQSAQLLGLDDRIQFLGKKSDVRDILAITDIFVLASYREGVPRSVIEAQAMGLPSVVTDIRGSREIVANNETGIIVPTHDPDALSRALQILIDNGELRYELGERGRESVKKNFQEKQVFQRILDAYQQCLLTS